MDTPSREIEDTATAFEFADGDVKELFDEHEDAACDREHLAPEADDDAAEAIGKGGSAPNEDERVSEIMLREEPTRNVVSLPTCAFPVMGVFWSCR